MRQRGPEPAQEKRRTARRAPMPNGARFRTARNPEKRGIPKSAESQTGVCGILCVRSYSSQQELRMTKPRKPREADSGFDLAALDQLLGERRTMGEIDELFRRMKKALMERALAGELTHHLGYAVGEAKPKDQPNHRNGSTPKTVLTEDGAIPVAIPRDRAGTFEPQLIPKNARRLPRFDATVLSLYARG